MPNLSTLPDTVLSTATIGAAQVEAGAVVEAGIGAAAVTGAKASAALRRKVLCKGIPTVPTTAGTTEVLVTVPFTGTVASVVFAFKDTLATSDTNYITFAVVNKGQAGSGTTNVLSTGNSSTTKVTGGSAYTGYVARQPTLSGTPADLVVTAGDVLAIQIVATVGTALANTLTEGNCNIGIDVTT